MDVNAKEELLGSGLYRRKRWWRSKLIWAAAIVAAVACAYLAVALTQQGSRGVEEPAVEAPPPIVSASGPVVPEKRARLSFTDTGRVKRLTVQPGDQVKQGQILAQLEPSALQSGEAATSAGTPDLYIIAPFDGTVGLVPINEGESVMPGDVVVVVGDLSRLRVEIEDLSEADVGRLSTDQRADLTFEAFPGRKVPGRVARISPMNNAKGGGVNYDVVIEFVGGDLPPIRWGMTAHAEIQVDAGR